MLLLKVPTRINDMVGKDGNGSILRRPDAQSFNPFLISEIHQRSKNVPKNIFSTAFSLKHTLHIP
jgi:hypothetical protein